MQLEILRGDKSREYTAKSGYKWCITEEQNMLGYEKQNTSKSNKKIIQNYGA